MQDCYKKPYFTLFNEVTDIVEQLKKAQTKTEQMLISNENNNEDEEEGFK
jgi:hypothetical protein